MGALKPKEKLIDLARAKLSKAVENVNSNETLMQDFQNAHPSDYMENPEFWALKEKNYKLRDEYYDSSKQLHDRIFFFNTPNFYNFHCKKF